MRRRSQLGGSNTSQKIFNYKGNIRSYFFLRGQYLGLMQIFCHLRRKRLIFVNRLLTWVKIHRDIGFIIDRASKMAELLLNALLPKGVVLRII